MVENLIDWMRKNLTRATPSEQRRELLRDIWKLKPIEQKDALRLFAFYTNISEREARSLLRAEANFFMEEESRKETEGG